MEEFNKESLRGISAVVGNAEYALGFSEEIILKLIDWSSSLSALDTDDILRLLTFAEQSEAEYSGFMHEADELLKQAEMLKPEQKLKLEELSDAAKRVLAVSQAAKANIYALPGKASYEQNEGKHGQLDPEVIKALEQATKDYKLAYNTFSDFDSSFRPGTEQETKHKCLTQLLQSWAGAHFMLAFDYEQFGKLKIQASENDIDKLMEGMTVWDMAIAHYKRIAQVADKATRAGIQLDNRFASIAQEGITQIAKNGAELATAIGLNLSD